MPPLRSIASGLAGCLLCAAASASDLIPLSPSAFTPGDATPPAQAAPGDALSLPLPFASPSAPDRVYWDLPLRRLPPQPLALELSCDDPAAIRAISLHLQCGSDWLSAQKTLDSSGPATLLFDPSEFTPEAGSPDWRHASTLRLSIWKGAPRDATLLLRSLRSQLPPIAILRPSDLTAPGESPLAALCAARALRLFEQAGLPASLLPDDPASLDLRPFRLLVLPYNPTLSKKHIDLLRRFVKRGGRLAVFYNSDDRLAQLLGFSLLPYATQSENWTSLSFDPAAAPSLPPSMPHLTRHLLPVRALAPDASTLGLWISPDGFPVPSLPAAASSPRGFWFSHIPPLASPSALQWLLASLAASDPALQPTLDSFLAESRRRDAQAAPLLASSPPSPSEIRAVWTLPLSPRLRPDTLRLLADRGINTLFENLLSLADDLPRSPPLQTRIARAAQSAHDAHLSLHVWLPCWNLDGAPPERIAAFRAQKRLLPGPNGNDLNWLNPQHPDNQHLLLETVATLAKLGVDGIHLDYIRYPAPPDPSQIATLRDDLSTLVANASRAAREAHPSIRLSAAVYPTPSAAAELAQDWPHWLRDGLLDFASPMLYLPDASRFAHQLDLCLAAAPSPSLLLPGIGTGADESQLDALSTAQQIAATRQRHTAGFALFQLDSDLTSRLLPALSLPPPPTP